MKIKENMGIKGNDCRYSFLFSSWSFGPTGRRAEPLVTCSASAKRRAAPQKGRQQWLVL